MSASVALTSKFPRFRPEAISRALFALLQTAQYDFRTFSRRGDLPENVDAALQPYLALIELGGRQTTVTVPAQGLERWMLEYAAVVYIRRPAVPEAIPGTLLNEAWYAIVNVMRSPQPMFQRQQLGGIVDNAWIEGNCVFNTGILDEQMRLLVPIVVDVGV